MTVLKPTFLPPFFLRQGLSLQLRLPRTWQSCPSPGFHTCTSHHVLLALNSEDLFSGLIPHRDPERKVSVTRTLKLTEAMMWGT